MREEVYAFHQYDRPERGVNMLMAGVSYCDSSYRIERSAYDHFVIEHVEDGEGMLETGGRAYEVGAGDTYFLYPGRAHRYYCREERWIKRWIVISGELAETMFRVYMREQPDVLYGFDIDRSMRQIIDLAKDRGISYEVMTDRVAVEVHRILIAAREYSVSKPRSVSASIRDYIDANLYRPLRLDELTQRFGYSKNHLINLFRESCGMTPYAYYEKQKMLVARELLVNTSTPIGEIAARLGFENPQYFSKCFKRYFDAAPSHVRRGR